MNKRLFAVFLTGAAVVALLVVVRWVGAVFTKAQVLAVHSCVESLASASQRALQTNSSAFPDGFKASQRIDQRLLVGLAGVGLLDCGRLPMNTAGHLCDAWGSEILIMTASRTEGTTNISVISIGPDRKQGTRDDIVARRSVPR